jgi:hypothetical protein
VMVIVLTPYELQMTAAVGLDRYKSAIERGRDPGLGPSRNRIPSAPNDVRGARCEFAASVGLNLFWRPYVDEIRERDVGGIVEVRSTDLATGRLIVKPTDEDSAPFLLVHELPRPGHYDLVGWIMAMTAKALPLVRGFGDPAHFVGRSMLREPSELRRMCHLKMVRCDA